MRRRKAVVIIRTCVLLNTCISLANQVIKIKTQFMYVLDPKLVNLTKVLVFQTRFI